METPIDRTAERGRAESKPKRTKPDNRWTLLFIGDHGKVVTLKRFKSFTFFAGFIFVLSLATIALLYWYNQSIDKNNEKLQSSLDILQKRIKALRHEKDILMARLVLAEARAKESLGDITENPAPKSLQVDKQSVSSLEQESLKSGIKDMALAAAAPGNGMAAALTPAGVWGTPTAGMLSSEKSNDSLLPLSRSTPPKLRKPPAVLADVR